MDFGLIEREIARFDSQEFHGGVTNSLIEAAELAIGLRFPPSYVEFLRRLGCGYVSFQEFIGLGGPPHLDLVKEATYLREHSKISRFPRQLIPVLADGFGNYECIDTSRPMADGECSVVSWLHDGGDDQDCEEIAKSYLEWFLSVLRMIQSVDTQDVR